MNNETTDGGATAPCISLLDRWRYIKADPHGARALLFLLEHGKGTPEDFDTMVDRIILSMVGEGLFKLSNAQISGGIPSAEADCSPFADQIAKAILSTRHTITHESVTIYANGSGKNARHELQQRIESVLANAELTRERSESE